MADEGYVGPDQFFIKYERDDGVVYAGGRWSHRLDIQAVEQQTDGLYAGPYILPIEYQQSERWSEITGKLITPRILSSEQWLRFLNSLFASILSEEEKAGVVMHFDADDYFLYLNERSDIEARLIIEKPADYTVSERISFGDFIRRGMPQLNSFIESEGVTERRVVFNTGDAGPYSLPFLYVDLDFPIAVFVRYPAAPRDGATMTEGTQVAQSVGHIVQSHLHFDADDYFLYLNERSDIEARLIIEKPADYTVSERISFGDFIRRGMPQLNSFIESEGVTERRVVFNTGDAGPYSLPFLYVDLDFPIAVFVRYPAAPRDGLTMTEGTQVAQSVGHIVQSHLGGLAVRPVSSLFRLLFVAKDAAVETIKPTWMVTLDALPIPPIHRGPGMDLAKWEQNFHRDTVSRTAP